MSARRDIALDMGDVGIRKAEHPRATDRLGMVARNWLPSPRPWRRRHQAAISKRSGSWEIWLRIVADLRQFGPSADREHRPRRHSDRFCAETVIIRACAAAVFGQRIGTTSTCRDWVNPTDPHLNPHFVLNFFRPAGLSRHPRLVLLQRSRADGMPRNKDGLDGTKLQPRQACVSLSFLNPLAPSRLHLVLEN